MGNDQLCVQRLTDLPRYDLKEGTVYGRGQWASSIRYHDGRFYVWFSPNDEPHRGYIYTAEDPAGEWTLVSRPPHHHDASLFFDDDGKVYLFYGTGQLRQLKSDLSDVEPGGIDQRYSSGMPTSRDFWKEVRHSSITADIT